MQQILRTSSLVASFVIVLAGCNINDETSLQDKRTERTMPIGYYSNGNHEKNGGNAIILDGADNDGPFVEIMDHTLGKESEINKRVMRSSNSDSELNPMAPVNNRENTRFGDPMFGQSDRNYHGHLNHAGSTQRQSYYNGYEGKYVESIARAVKMVGNVADARVIVYQNHVLVGLELVNENLAKETKRNVHQLIAQHVAGKQVYYVTNESRFNAIKVLDNELKNGSERKQINADIERLLRNMKKE